MIGIFQLGGRFSANSSLVQTGKAVLLTGALLCSLFLISCNSGSLSEGLESAARPQSEIGTPNAPASQNQTANNTALQDPALQQQPAGSQDIAQNNQVASLPTGKSVTFLPVSNAPQTAVTNLARSIRSQAASNQVPVAASVQQGAHYQVKGYLSALEDGSGTLLVYVWDVLDRNNKRVYRINGQEQTSGKSADPWASVTPQMLDNVARSTVLQLKRWLASQA